MKKLILIATILITTFLSAQESLKITYEGIYSYNEHESNMRFPGVFISSDFELIISKQKAEFRYIDKLITQPEGGDSMVPLTSDDFYFDLDSDTYFVKQEIFGKTYLVSDTLQKVDWNITKKEKEIAGITTRKATFKTKDGDEITAWYAPKLPYKIGPETYSGLPGLILQIDVYTETQEKGILGEHFVAKKVEFLKKDTEIEFPKGKTISFEEAERIADEHFDKILELNKDGVDKD